MRRFSIDSSKRHTSEEEFAPLLEQFEVYLDGEESARLHVCQALVGRNQEAFDEAFEVLLNEQDATRLLRTGSGAKWKIRKLLRSDRCLLRDWPS